MLKVERVRESIKGKETLEQCKRIDFRYYIFIIAAIIIAAM